MLTLEYGMRRVDASEGFPPFTSAVHRASIQHDVSRQDILGHNRRPHIVRARWQVMRELRDRGWSLTAIGDAMNRHHTTVLHGLRRLEG